MRDKVAVIGLGYVGLGIAIAASKKYDVIGLDLDKNKVAQLKSGISYIEGISNYSVDSAIKSNRFVPSSDANMMANCQIIVVCVPTPLNSDRKPDLNYIDSACDFISKNVKKSALIINESTSFPGTLRDHIVKRIESKTSIKHEYASSPERVDPGNENWNLINTPRLISGLTESATTKAIEFYSSFANNIVEVASPEVAETAKLFENTFRQVNIALVNELAMICNSLNVNVFDVIEAANTKPYGFMKFNPGPGVGGHCIPVDPSYLAYRAEQAGVKARFIDLANQVNLDMPKYVIERAEKIVGGLKGKKVLIAGVSYKPEIADVRETPAELIRNEAIAKGAEVYWFDPIVEKWESGKVEKIDANTFDLVIFQTIHSVMDIESIKKAGKYAFDCTGKVPGVDSI